MLKLIPGRERTKEKRGRAHLHLLLMMMNLSMRSEVMTKPIPRSNNFLPSLFIYCHHQSTIPYRTTKENAKTENILLDQNKKKHDRDFRPTTQKQKTKTHLDHVLEGRVCGLWLGSGGLACGLGRSHCCEGLVVLEREFGVTRLGGMGDENAPS